MVREEDPLMPVTGEAGGGGGAVRWFHPSRRLLRPLLLVLVLVVIVVMLRMGLVHDHAAAGGIFEALANPQALKDDTVAPCADFYRHACGGFEKQTLPKDHADWMYAFNGVRERVASELTRLLRADRGQAGQLYAACTDERGIEDAGIAPIEPYLKRVDAMGTNESLVERVAELCLLNAKPFFLWNVGADADSVEQVLYMQQGGLTLPDVSYYRGGEHAPKLEAFRTFMENVLVMVGAGRHEARASADSVIEVESELAAMHLSHEEERAARSLPPLSVDQVSSGMAVPGGFDWGRLFALMEVPSDPGDKVVRVIDVDYFSKLCKWLAGRTPRSLIPYVRWRILDALMGHLGKEFQAQDLTFREALFGVSRDPPRDRLCLHTLNLFVPDTVGALYVKEGAEGGGERRRKVEGMLGELRKSFAILISQASWMSPSAKRAAQSKLRGMIFSVGGPHKTPLLPFKCSRPWFDVSVSIAKHLAHHQLKRIGKTRGRGDWGSQLGASTVNAFYQVHSNALFVPQAMLQRPFLGEGGGDGGVSVADWGSLGGLMGHEMSHGFDSVGRLFGPDLILKSWWDKGTARRYDERAQCIGRRYASFEVDGHHVSGNATLEEDIADGAGLKIAYEALLASRGGQGGGKEDSRGFFLAWAQTWCGLETRRQGDYAILQDPHAPPRVRVNAALGRFPPFREAYGCGGGGGGGSGEGQCHLW